MTSAHSLHKSTFSYLVSYNDNQSPEEGSNAKSPGIEHL
jgi:hypothetical protein